MGEAVYSCVSKGKISQDFLWVWVYGPLLHCLFNSFQTWKAFFYFLFKITKFFEIPDSRVEMIFFLGQPQREYQYVLFCFLSFCTPIPPMTTEYLCGRYKGLETPMQCGQQKHISFSLCVWIWLLHMASSSLCCFHSYTSGSRKSISLWALSPT